MNRNTRIEDIVYIAGYKKDWLSKKSDGEIYGIWNWAQKNKEKLLAKKKNRNIFNLLDNDNDLLNVEWKKGTSYISFDYKDIKYRLFAHTHYLYIVDGDAQSRVTSGYVFNKISILIK